MGHQGHLMPKINKFYKNINIQVYLNIKLYLVVVKM